MSDSPNRKARAKPAAKKRATRFEDILRLSGRKIRLRKEGKKWHPMSAWRLLTLEEREKLLLKEAQMSASQWRKYLAEKTGIRLRNDSQVTEARRVTMRDRALVERANQADQFEDFWRERFPESTPDEVRKAVMAFLMMENAALGEAKISILAAREVREIERLTLDREKFEELKAKAAQADEAAQIAEDGGLSSDEKRRRINAIFGL